VIEHREERTLGAAGEGCSDLKVSLGGRVEGNVICNVIGDDLLEM
jgi:hypothetical protein